MLIVFSVVPVLYGIVTGIQLWLIRPNAVKYAKVYLIISLCVGLLEAGLIAIESEGRAPIILPTAKAIVPFIVWWTYLARSIRVRNTFFRSNQVVEPPSSSNGDPGAEKK